MACHLAWKDGHNRLSRQLTSFAPAVANMIRTVLYWPPLASFCGAVSPLAIVTVRGRYSSAVSMKVS